MGVWMDGLVGVNVWMSRYVDEWMNGSVMDGWMSGCVDG